MMINEFLAAIGPGEKILIGACTIIGILCGVIGKMFYRRQTEILDAVKEREKREKECQDALPDTFAPISIMEHYHEGRPARVVIGKAPPLIIPPVK